MLKQVYLGFFFLSFFTTFSEAYFWFVFIIIYYWSKGILESVNQNTKGLKSISVWKEGNRNDFAQYRESYILSIESWSDGDLDYFFLAVG